MSTASELQEQGIRLFRQRDYEAAAELFQQAREAYAAASQPDMAAEMEVNLGLVHRALGQHDQALALMQQALQFFRQQGDRRREAQVLGNMGGVYAAQGDTEQAMTCYRQAADTFHELGEDRLYKETLLALGDLQVRQGRIMAGAAAYEVGLEGADDLTPTQRILKGLLGIKRRLTGGAPPAPPPGEGQGGEAGE